MKKHCLSIITVCKNVKDDIEKTCISIKNQTFKDFEWIVIDGGSTDGTLEILAKYKKYINVLVSEPDTGIYNAMNKGIKLSNSTWLNFMNAGDVFADDHVLEKVFFNKTYKKDILYGQCIISGENKIQKYKKNINKQFLGERTFNHQSSFIKKQLFDKYGLYDENYRIVADWEKWIVFLKNGCVFQYLNFPIAIYDANGVSSNYEKLKKEADTVKNKHFKTTRVKIIYFLGIPVFRYTVKDIEKS